MSWMVSSSGSKATTGPRIPWKIRSCVPASAGAPIAGASIITSACDIPMKRTGKRGEGLFERITWDEALDKVASELTRVKKTYGNSAMLVPYGTGSYNQINGRQTAQRLLNLYGGSLGQYNSYSWACISSVTPTVYGTDTTGNQRQDWVNAKYILMWGWNPCEMRDGTNTEYLPSQGARKGCAHRLHRSAHDLERCRPCGRMDSDPARHRRGHDVGDGLRHDQESLYDAEFVKRHCSGFDESQMPPDAKGVESYQDYILGRATRNPKPRMGGVVTGVPAETIARIAREYATRKPGVLYQGYGMQRRAYGEQVVRAGCVLAALTGNVGIPGGWAGRHGPSGPGRRTRLECVPGRQ